MLKPIQTTGPEGKAPPTVRLKPTAPGTRQGRVGPTPPKSDDFQLASTQLAYSKSENGQIIVRVFDAVTGELIRQIPPAERLRLAAVVTALAQRFLGRDG